MPGPTTLSQSVSGFDPRSIPGCTLWLDAADPNVFTFSSGNNIATWRDKSASGLSGTSVNSPTLTANSVNGLPAVVFSSGTQYIDYGNNLNLGTNTIYIFTVVQFDSTANGGIVGKSAADGNKAGRWTLLRNNSELGTESVFDTGTGTATTGYADTSTNPQLISTFWDRANAFIFQNGTQRATNVLANTGNFSTTYPLWVGAYQSVTGTTPPLAGFYFIGKICEIIIYQPSAAITMAQRQAVEGYLAWKWRLEVSSNFIPISIPGCVLWFDANDSTSIIRSGTTITQVRDKSGLNNHTTTTSGTSTYLVTGLNNLPTISITGGGFFTGTFTTPITNTTLQCFIVGTINVSSGQFGRMLSLGLLGTTDFNNAAYAIPFVRGNNTASVYSARNNVANPGAYIPISYDVPFLAQSGFDGTNMNTSVNGGTIFSSGSTGSFNITGFGLGTNCDTTDNGGKHTGFISEVLVFSGSVFTQAQRSLIEGYLASKWGISGVPSSALPSTHPFVLYAPFPRLLTPNDIGILPEYWFDAADSTTISPSVGNLTSLANKGYVGSAGNITVSAGTPTTGSILRNGNNLINLPSGAKLQFTASFPANVRSRFFVSRPTTAGAVVFLYQAPSGSQNGRDLVQITADPWLQEQRQGVGAAMRTGTISSQQNNFAIYTFVNAATTANNRIAITGTSQGLAASAAAASYLTSSVVAVVNDFGGQELGEIISYNNELTLSQQQLIEGYLAWKWGLNRNLPTTHPYFLFPPVLPIGNIINITKTLPNGNLFVAKYDTNGIVLWAAHMISVNTTTLVANEAYLTYDTNGNVYVGGIYANCTSLIIYSENIGSTSITLQPYSTSGQNCFISKYNDSGLLLWAARIIQTSGSWNNNWLTSVSSDSAGSVYVTGYFLAGNIGFFNQGGASAAITLTTTAFNEAAYLVKYLSNGNVSWAARIFRTNTFAGGLSIKVTSSGTAYLLGYYNSASVDIYNQGPSGSLAFNLANPGTGGCVYLAQYNTNGGAIWAARMTGGTNNESFPKSITVDQNGNAYVFGIFAASTGSTDTLNIFTQGGSTAAFTLTNATNLNGTTGFLVKYNSSGTALWATKMTYILGGQAGGVAVDSTANVYVVGSYTTNPVNFYNQGSTTPIRPLNLVGNSDVFVAKYDTNGNVLWTTRMSGTSGTNNNGNSISVDNAGNILVTGQFNGPTLIIYNENGSLFGTLRNANAGDGFLVKYSSNGNAIWATRMTSSTQDRSLSVSTDNSNNSYISGFYTANPLTFNSATSN